VKADPVNSAKDTGTGVSGPAKNQLNKTYSSGPIATALRYGKQYDFRVRMRDLSGGGAEPEESPAVESPSAIGRCHFKRYVAPSQPRLANVPPNNDSPTNPDSLSIQRPFIGYPAVVYTGKYADPVARLKQASLEMLASPPTEREAFGIHDPDVDRIEVTVEVETLKMDNLQSVSGRENYVHLYTTTRRFPAVANENDYAAALEIPLVYRDVPVLHTGDELNLQTDFGFAGDIDDLAEIYLPTARPVRLTLRAVCEQKANDTDYYGLVSATNDREADSRYGHIIEVRIYRPSTDERDLVVDTAAAQRLAGHLFAAGRAAHRGRQIHHAFLRQGITAPAGHCATPRKPTGARKHRPHACSEKRRARAVRLFEPNPAYARAGQFIADLLIEDRFA
jgi:hypothetical protein